MTHEFVMYSPFVYLTGIIQESIYDLFLIIPVEPGKSLSVTDIEEHPSSNMIRCSIVDGDENVIESNGNRFVRKRFHFEHSKDSREFNKDEFEVTVFVERNGYIESKITVHYEDTDVLYYETDEANEIALNRPYVYLAQPHDDINNIERYFYPRMLIPTCGYGYSDECDDLLMTAGRNGVCENLIALYPRDDSDEIEVIFPTKVNEIRFQDTGNIDGNFSAIVLLFNSLPEAESFVGMSGIDKNLLLANSEDSSSDDKTRSETKARTRSADVIPAHGILIDKD